jgi:hypothetical protein
MKSGFETENFLGIFYLPLLARSTLFFLLSHSFSHTHLLVIMPYTLLALENPLLDIQANVSDELLKKYKLKSNDAILAGDEHQPL